MPRSKTINRRVSNKTLYLLLLAAAASILIWYFFFSSASKPKPAEFENGPPPLPAVLTD